MSEPKVGVEPQTLSSIFEQYYTPPAAVPRPQSIPAPPSVPVASVIEPPKPLAPVQLPPPAYQPPAFNNQYDNSNGATMVQMPTAEYEKTSPQLIPYVRQSQWKEYIEKHNNSDFIKRLPVFQWPLLPNGAYRAFEAGDDFTYPNAFWLGNLSETGTTLPTVKLIYW